MAALDSLHLLNQKDNYTFVWHDQCWIHPCSLLAIGCFSAECCYINSFNTVKPKLFPQTDNKVITQKMPRPDFMVFVETGTIFICCQSSNASDLEIYWLNFNWRVVFLTRCLILSHYPIPIDNRENFGWSRARGHSPGFFQLPWVHFSCWFM